MGSEQSTQSSFPNKWTPLKGKYKGSTQVLTYEVNADMTINLDNTLTIHKLTSKKGGGPNTNEEDLIHECKSKNVRIDPNDITDTGFSVKGSCIDEIKKTLAKDGKPLINGEIGVYNNTDTTLSLQLDLHVCLTEEVCFDEMISVPLKKYN